MKLIDKDALVAEIEKWISGWTERLNNTNPSNPSFFEGGIAVGKHILSFLDTLEVKEVQEEPVVIDAPSEDYVKGFADGRLYQQRQKEEPVSEDLEEAAILHYKDVMEYEAKTGLKPAYMTSFKAGARWQKNKMMEDAVDGVVAASAGALIATGFVKSEDVNVKFGDKIKIIIIKED